MITNLGPRRRVLSVRQGSIRLTRSYIVIRRALPHAGSSREFMVRRRVLAVWYVCAVYVSSQNCQTCLNMVATNAPRGFSAVARRLSLHFRGWRCGHAGSSYLSSRSSVQLLAFMVHAGHGVHATAELTPRIDVHRESMAGPGVGFSIAGSSRAVAGAAVRGAHESKALARTHER